jgi:hypothetical protein
MVSIIFLEYLVVFSSCAIVLFCNFPLKAPLRCPHHHSHLPILPPWWFVQSEGWRGKGLLLLSPELTNLHTHSSCRVNGLPIVTPFESSEAPIPHTVDPSHYATTSSSYGSPQKGKGVISDPIAPIPYYVENDRKVLRVYAYFKEAVTDSAIEDYRVRKCVILLYLVDGTMQVSLRQFSCGMKTEGGGGG